MGRSNPSKSRPPPDSVLVLKRGSLWVTTKHTLDWVRSAQRKLVLLFEARIHWLNCHWSPFGKDIGDRGVVIHTLCHVNYRGNRIVQSTTHSRTERNRHCGLCRHQESTQNVGTHRCLYAINGTNEDDGNLYCRHLFSPQEIVQIPITGFMGWTGTETESTGCLSGPKEVIKDITGKRE